MSLMNVLAMANPGGAEGGGSALMGFIPIILMFAVFWFLIIRPQKKQADQRKAMIEAIKRGDKIVTNGGLFATVRDVKGDRIRCLGASAARPWIPTATSAVTGTVACGCGAVRLNRGTRKRGNWSGGCGACWRRTPGWGWRRPRWARICGCWSSAIPRPRRAVINTP